MTRRVWLVVAVVALAITAGCLGGDDADDGATVDADAGELDDAAAVAEADAPEADAAGTELYAATAGVSQDDESSALGDRDLIRTATVTVSVENAVDAETDLTEAAADRGGYPSASNRETHEYADGNRTVVEVTYRVPAGEFEAFLDRVEDRGAVTAASTDTDDVTDRLVDLEARIENLEDQRDRLRELYDDAEDTDDVLAVEERLSEVQAEIERLDAQREGLEDRVAYSTVTVTLTEEAPERVDPEPAWYETSVIAAFLASVEGVAVTARAAVVGAAYLAPYLLAVGAPAAAIYGATRRFGRGRPAASTDADGSEDDEPETDAGVDDDPGPEPDVSDEFDNGTDIDSDEAGTDTDSDEAGTDTDASTGDDE